MVQLKSPESLVSCHLFYWEQTSVTSSSTKWSLKHPGCPIIPFIALDVLTMGWSRGWIPAQKWRGVTAAQRNLWRTRASTRPKDEVRGRHRNPWEQWPTLFLRAKLLESRLPLCDPMDCSHPGFSICGILQARILQWVAMPSSRGSSRSRDQTQVSYVSCIGRWVLFH